MDESGDFGLYEPHSPYYIISMVFHDQAIDLTAQIRKLDDELAHMGYANHEVHTEPLIRREEAYKFLSPNERRAIFSKLFIFFLKSNIKYKSFIFHKKEVDNIYKLQDRMTKVLSTFIRRNLSFFQGFDKVILYYDNGQCELKRVLNSVLSNELVQYEVRNVMPCNYKLFQVADLVCTLELSIPTQ